MSARVTTNGVVTQWWNDDERVYRRWSVDGELLERRPYDPAELAALDEASLPGRRRIDRRLYWVGLPAALERDETYLALDAPTAAQRAAQVDALTRHTAQIIRLLSAILGETLPAAAAVALEGPPVKTGVTP